MKIYRFIVTLFLLVSTLVWADDFVPADEDDIDVGANIFTLDADNTGGDIELRFGETLAEFLRWDDTNARFALSDDLDLALAQLLNIRLENLAAAPTCDVISTGRIYFDTTTSAAFVCTGTVWTELGGSSSPSGSEALAAARYRDTSTTNINALATGNIVPWNTEDFEDIAFIHDNVTNNSRIQVTQAAKYLVSGSVNVINTSTNNFRYNGRLKFRINGVTELPMTFQPGYIRRAGGQEETSLVFSTVLELNANDYFEVLVDRENTVVGPANMVSGSSSLSVTQLQASSTPGGAPFVESSAFLLSPTTTQAISLIGSGFLPSSTVSIPGFTGTINSATVVSPTQIDLNVTTTATTGTYDIVVDNDGTDNTLWSGNGVNLFEVATITGTGVAGTYTESFETDFGSWVSSGLAVDWTRNTGGTGSGGTGPTGASAGTTYVYTEASNPNFPNVEFGFETTDFAQAQSISFDYHMFGGDMGTLEIQTLYSGVWTTRFTLAGQQQAVQGNPYLNQVVDLSTFPVQGIRFFYTSGSGFTGDCSVDNVSIISI